MRILAITALLLGFASPASAADLTNTDVSFQNGDLTLHGTVVAPVGGQDLPGIVMVHGSGTPYSREKYRDQAEAFARAGVATLVYDKREVGYSTTNRSYSVLADDALAAVRKLREQPGIDPKRVGVWGLSEGGWVAPLAASRSSDVAFVVVLGANGGPPARQQAWNVQNQLRAQGVTGSLLRTVTETEMRLAVGAGIFPEANYDPVPVLEKIRQPVLGLWGTRDTLTPPVSSARIFRDALERSGNTHYTLRLFEGADHGLHKTNDGFVRLPEFAPGYLDAVTSWVNALADGPPKASTDVTTQQDERTPELPALSWYESPGVQLGVVILLVVAFGVFLLVEALLRLRGRREPSPVGRQARWLAGAGLLATVGLFGYLIALLAGSTRSLGPVFLNRTLPWLAVQLVAVGAVVALVRLVLAWRRSGKALPPPVVLPLVAGMVFVPWAFYWGLLLP
jgi:dienelactone hydrolase